MLLRISIKTFCLLLVILIAFKVKATNYISNLGNDANAGSSPSSAWQSLNKLNLFKNLKPGDSVLFKKGDSGSAGNPIICGPYGSEEKRVITGHADGSVVE